MNATKPEQMVLSEEVACTTKISVYAARNGSLVTLPKHGRELFYVYYCGNCQVFFPVFADGTISKSGTQPDFAEYAGQEAEIFLPEQISGLQLADGKIVWEKYK